MSTENPELIRVVKPEKRSLLQRYDIPVEHLSYEYISNCTNSKTLERILLILRSGEEGSYPHLTKHAEDRLTLIKPNSKILRNAKPVLTMNMLEPCERNEIDKDIRTWMNEMQCRNRDLEEGKATLLGQSHPQPDIRQVENKTVKKNIICNTANIPKSKRISACDYAAWDKYDVDTEINKIDIKEEQRQLEIKRKQEKRRNAGKNNVKKEIIIDKSSLTGTELDVMAEQEKEKGNEAFRAGDYQDALGHYNSSIRINSNLMAYNNRAMTLIKLKNYEDAIRDCNIVLTVEYSNIKALLRRGLALEHLGKRSQALADYETALKLEPTNKTAIAGVKKLKKSRDTKNVRMVIEEKCFTSDERTADSESASGQNEENNTSELKINGNEDPSNCLCFCDRAPGPSRDTKPRPHFKGEYCPRKQNESVQGAKHSVSDSELSNRKIKFKDDLTRSMISSSTKEIDLLKTPNSASDMKFSSINNSNVKSIFSYKTIGESGKSSTVIIEELPAEEGNDIYRNRKNRNRAESVRNKVEIDKKPEEMSKSTDEVEKAILTPGTQCRDNKMQIVVSNNKDQASSSSKKIEDADLYKNNLNQFGKDNGERFDSISSPWEFMRTWESLKHDNDYKLHAKLLRSISRNNNLVSVFGNKLDGAMLSTILHCLKQHFLLRKDKGLLVSLLQSLSKVNRFTIVIMFLNTEDKEALGGIFSFLEEEEVPETRSLRQIYCT